MHSTGTAEINALFEKQKHKSLTLRAQPVEVRKSLLKKLLRWVETNRVAIQGALYKDLKKPATETDLTEIYVVISEIRFALKKIDEWVRPKNVPTPVAFTGTSSQIHVEPKGVCLIISPWNYPFQLAVAPLASAIAAGNCVVLKPSEISTHTSALLAGMVKSLFSEDEIAVIEGGKEITTELLSFPFNHIFFTGSVPVGKIIMKAAAENLASVTLELGGKCPVIVDQSANIKDAAEKISVGKFLNCGQTCVAPDYVLVHESKKQELIRELIIATENFFNHGKTGFENSPDYGRIINDVHFRRLTSLIDAASKNKETFHLGGKTNENENFIEPLIVSGVMPDSPLLQAEIFGPLLPVISFDNTDHVIRAVNNRPKPLALYVFGKNKKNIQSVLQNTSSGGACINECNLQFMQHELPFGGVNHSGIGKSHGYYGFLAFSNEKGVLKQRVGFTGISLFYPPFTKTTKKLTDILLKWL